MNFRKHHDDPENEEVIDLEGDGSPESKRQGHEDPSDLDASIAKIAKLKAELAESRAESKEYLDGWQRLKADVANLRKGEAEREARRARNAQEAIIDDLIPIIDHFDMARAGAGWQQVDANWRIGVEAIIGQLEQLLERYGASRIGAVGESFDPRLHEAISEVPAESPAQEGTIVAILRSGWKMGDAVLRPAQVEVAHGS